MSCCGDTYVKASREWWMTGIRTHSWLIVNDQNNCRQVSPIGRIGKGRSRSESPCELGWNDFSEPSLFGAGQIILQSDGRKRCNA